MASHSSRCRRIWTATLVVVGLAGILGLTPAHGQIDHFSYFRTVAGIPNERDVAYVKSAADLDQDGYADYLVHYTGGWDCDGCRAVVGLSSGLDSQAIWTHRSPGPHVGGQAGEADVGDFDGDGRQDVVLGWSEVPNGSETGTGLVIAQTVDGSKVFWTRRAEDGVWDLGKGVAVLGDVTGDGTDEVVVVTRWVPGAPPNAGQVSILSGRDGSDVYVYTGTEGGEGLGGTIHQGVGDVDGDGLPDFAYRKRRLDIIVVRSGRDGSLIWEITDPDDQIGWSVAAPGDLDGDGVDDLVYPIEDRILAASVIDRKMIWEYRLTGLPAMMLSTVKDVDDDGIDDVLVSQTGIRFDERPYGAVVAVSGRTGKELWRLRDPEMSSDVDHFALDATGLGDVNGDGLADLAVRRRMHYGDRRSNLFENQALIFTRESLHAVDSRGLSGQIDLRLHVPAAPSRPYALLFSMHGGQTPLGSHTLPLASDWLLFWSVAHPLFGVLDTHGKGSVSLGGAFTWPGGEASGAVSCAAIVFDPASPFGIRAITNRVALPGH